MATNKTASEIIENPLACPFCDADSVHVDVGGSGDCFCCKCQRSWALERRLVGYSFTDEEGDYHEVTEEPGDRISSLEERVRILREALTSIRDGSGPLGRWLDSENDTAIEEEGNDGSDEENVPENPNAVWEPYTEEEQRLWLDSVVAIADRALEATKEGA